MIYKLYGSEKPEVILIQLSARHENATIESEVAKIVELSSRPFVLAAVELEDWTVGLMPWWDGNVSRDPEAGRHAGETLDFVTMELLPELKRRFGELPVILGGYSLGGLFALWASSQTDVFQGIAAASPSVWIHGWQQFAKKNPTRVKRVYLSLGDREELVKNQAIARVGDNIRAQYELLQSQLGPENCTLVWEDGGHFADNDGRLARAFAWCLEGLAGE